MRHISRPSIPTILQNEGEIETKKLIKLYNQGIRKFSFDRNIYGNDKIREILKKVQFDKCCYCEKKVEMPDVEHFRPKSHYYWLVYDWKNLLLACETCNRMFKNDKFPISDEKNQAKSHNDDIKNENPLLINPYEENPEEFIEFKGTAIFAKNGNQKGKTTISDIGLNRPTLDSRKIDLYKLCKTIYQLSQNADAERKKDLENLLEEYSQKDKEYSLMIRCAIKDGFKY